MKILDFIKNLILGFWKNGFIPLCQIVLEHWVISLLVIILIAYLCSDSETAIYAWVLIGAFAIYSAVKAVIDVFVEIIISHIFARFFCRRFCESVVFIEIYVFKRYAVKNL